MLSKNDVLAMSNDELYNFLLPTINGMYEIYSKEYSKEEYNIFVLNAIEEAKNSLDNSTFNWRRRNWIIYKS